APGSGRGLCSGVAGQARRRTGGAAENKGGGEPQAKERVHSRILSERRPHGRDCVSNGSPGCRWSCATLSPRRGFGAEQRYWPRPPVVVLTPASSGRPASGSWGPPSGEDWPTSWQGVLSFDACVKQAMTSFS